MRLIAGGVVKSVRGITGQWMPPRDTAPGAFSALLEFENGVFGSLTYNAYGYFMASELFDPETGGPSAPGLESRLDARRQIVGGTRNELEAKERRNNIATREDNRSQMSGGRPSGFLGDLGLLVVCCEHGDMRQSPHGLYVYGEDGTTEVELKETRGQNSPELTELYDAVVSNKPLLHGGRWGLATLEVSLAIMQSAAEHRDIVMQHQVAAPDWA
jgi:phthalate 4,5-cis-dihydrodiol dehydrogenase